jgi:hypothetical protein
MSAFIVADCHIDGLITFAIDAKVSYWNGTTRISITTQNATEVGQILLDQNVRSVGYRYNDRIDAAEKNASASYAFSRFFGLPVAPLQKAITVLKSCPCFDYQACETDDYRTTLAHQIIDAIRGAAICALPGYDNAPWGLDMVAAKPAETPRPVAIIVLSPAAKAWKTRRSNRS